MITPNQKAQKERARAEAEHHQRYGAVDSMRLPERRFKSKTEMNAEQMVEDAEKEGLHMEIE